MPLPISDYAMIGDCESAALVGRDGSIDWLCWPRFDSDACFAALLGTPDHGRWQVAPAGDGARVTRRYRPGTLILETDFETEAGAVRVIDFMPVREEEHVSDLVRIIVGLRGRVRMRMDLRIRFDYGRIVPWVARTGDGNLLRAIAGPHALILQTPLGHHGENLATVADFAVERGDRVPLVLAYGASHRAPPPTADPSAALAETEAFWRDWSGHCNYEGPWREAVVRSLITVKALTYRPTGGIVAAPTTSLPEKVGGSRNWDYRFCWLRDASFTLLSLINAGYRAEAEAWGDWLLRAIAGAPAQMQPVYGVAGEPRLDEVELPWLPGYRDSRPVRIGNGAYSQLQIDAFGSVMDTLDEARRAGLILREASGALQAQLIGQLESVWDEPDEGIWEVRGGRRHFVHARLMAWVAFDRAVISAEKFGLPGPVERWRRLREEVRADILAHGWSRERGAFVQSYGGTALDASLLLMPIVGFLPPRDPRVLATTAAIERELMRDGLVLRYEPEEAEDGLDGDEGAFLACSFWLVDNMILQGRHDEARAMYERLLSLRNDVGLLAEQYDWQAGEQVGNFPQAFSHFALIDTAFNFRNVAGLAHEAQGADSDAGSGQD